LGAGGYDCLWNFYDFTGRFCHKKNKIKKMNLGDIIMWVAIIVALMVLGVAIWAGKK